MNYTSNAASDREAMLANAKEAAKLWKMLKDFGIVYTGQQKITAIKYLRERTGIGLKEAKDAWEFVEAFAVAA